jgi:hypothetical protein
LVTQRTLLGYPALQLVAGVVVAGVLLRCKYQATSALVGNPTRQGSKCNPPQVPVAARLVLTRLRTLPTTSSVSSYAAPDACEVGELFWEFLDTFSEIKSYATDNVTKQVANLSLNSTYGNFGQKEHEYTIKLVKKDKVEEIVSKYNYTILSDI